MFSFHYSLQIQALLTLSNMNLAHSSTISIFKYLFLILPNPDQSKSIILLYMIFFSFHSWNLSMFKNYLTLYNIKKYITSRKMTAPHRIEIFTYFLFVCFTLRISWQYSDNTSLLVGAPNYIDNLLLFEVCQHCFTCQYSHIQYICYIHIWLIPCNTLLRTLCESSNTLTVL